MCTLVSMLESLKHPKLVPIDQTGNEFTMHESEPAIAGPGFHGAFGDLLHPLAREDVIVDIVGQPTPARARGHILVEKNAARFDALRRGGDYVASASRRHVMQ